MATEKNKRSETFYSHTKNEIFHGITHHNQVWRPDPYDIEDIHNEGRECFERLLKRIHATEFSDSGRIMLLLGESGAGKTHLMRAFRNYTHDKALGYFAYMQMTSFTSNYARYALHYTIDSLDKPYFEPNGCLTGLMRLSNALIEGRQNIAQSDIDQLRDSELTQNELSRLVYKMADNILNSEANRFYGVDLNLMRAILYLQNSNPAIHARIRRYLRCEELSESDCATLGGLSSRIQEEEPEHLLQALAHLVFSIDPGAFVICLDQLEDIHLAENAEDNFRRAMQVMTKLAEIPNVIIIIACLDDIYKLLRNSLPAPHIARIEQDPDMIVLKAERKAIEILNLIAIRLQYLYESEEIEIDPDNSIDPLPKETPENLAGISIRKVLDWCRQEREKPIDSVQPSSVQGQPKPVPGTPPITKGNETAFVELSQLWNDYVADTHKIPDSSLEMLDLLDHSVGFCADELNSTFFFQTVQRNNYLEINIQSAEKDDCQQLTVGMCQKTPQGGALARQIDKLLEAAHKRKAVAIRSVEFPSNPNTKIAKQLGEFIANGGKKVTVSDSDWRAMVAMKSFRMQYGQRPDFPHWLHSEQPLLSLPSFQEILKIEYYTRETLKKENLPEQELVSTIPATQLPLSVDPSKLKIGTFQDNQRNPYLIETSQLVRHAAFLGGSGSGKTRLCCS